MKAEHQMGRNYFRGHQGDRINAVLAAAGYNVWSAPSASCGYEKLSVQSAPTYLVSPTQPNPIDAHYHALRFATQGVFRELGIAA